MNEIMNFVKGIFSAEDDKCPVGLCSFEHGSTLKPSRKVNRPRKREMRLSELMDK